MVYGPVAPAANCKALFGHPNAAFSPLAQISATTAEVGAPASYLLSDNSAEPWRSTSTVETDLWLWMSDDSSFSVGLVGLLFNSSAKATRMRARLYSSTHAVALVEDSPTYDSGAIRAWAPWQASNEGGATLAWGEFPWGGVPPADVLASRPRHWLHPIMSDGLTLRPLSCKAVRITISGTTPLSYWEAGMLWASVAYFGSRNFALDNFTRGWVDLSTSVQGMNGRRQVLDRGRLRQLGLLFGAQARNVVDNRFETWAASVGMGSPMLVIPEPGNPATWWNDAGPYALNALGGSRREVTMSDLWEAPVGLLEWR